jgi:hypothetical protein
MLKKMIDTPSGVLGEVATCVWLSPRTGLVKLDILPGLKDGACIPSFRSF